MAQAAELDQAAARLKERAERSLTWHNLSRITAKVLLGLAWALWTRVYWLDIQPQLVYTLDGLILFALDVALAVGLGFASATVPPTLLASLFAHSPADVILNRMRQRIGPWGFGLVIGVGIALTVNSFFILVEYWGYKAANPASTLAGSSSWAIYRLAFATTILLIGFPAWAINRMTPEQWVDAALMGREALRIQRIIDLEEAAGKALIAKMNTLLMADLATLALHERATNNAEVAAILAASNRAVARSLRLVGRTFKSLAGMDAFVQHDGDDMINARYQHIAGLLTNGADGAAFASNYAGALVEAPVQPSRSHSDAVLDAELDASGRVDASGQVRQGPPGSESDHRTAADSALDAAQRAFGRQPFKNTDVRELLRCSKSTAANHIANWIAHGDARELTDQKFTYVLTTEEAR